MANTIIICVAQGVTDHYTVQLASSLAKSKVLLGALLNTDSLYFGN